MNNDTTLADQSLDAPSNATETTVVKAKRKPGRKEDTEGKTKLGQARNIYRDNPGLSVKELKQKFEADLSVNPQVAQTYASLVRRKKS